MCCLLPQQLSEPEGVLRTPRLWACNRLLQEWNMWLKLLSFILSILTHWGRDKMAAIFQTTFSNAFSWMKMFKFRLRFHWSLFPRVPINNIPALVQIMAWRRPGDKPLSEPMMVNLLTHICVTRPQWVNHWHTYRYVCIIILIKCLCGARISVNMTLICILYLNDLTSGRLFSKMVAEILRELVLFVVLSMVV